MRSIQSILVALLLAGTAAGLSSQGAQQTLPKDIYPETGNRFPVVKPDGLDETAKKLYDARVDGFGPGGIRLYSPSVAESMSSVNDFLRRKSGLEPRIVELTILVIAREMDCEYVWTAHEPAAKKAGLDQSLIDAVKYRKPVTGIGEQEAAIIQLGREAIEKHRVGSETFAHAAKLFGNQGLVNILSLMGDYASTTLLLNAADQHIRPADKPLLPLS